MGKRSRYKHIPYLDERANLSSGSSAGHGR